MRPLEFDRVAPSRTLLTRAKRESKTGEARRDRTSHRAASCPSWDRTRTLLIQSSPVEACLEGTMSASGDLPGIGAPTVKGKCPDRSGETLVKCLQRLCASPLNG